MPTTNPRLMVTLAPDQRELLGELAALQGRSAASLIRELVDTAMPLFRAMLPIMRANAAAIEGQPAKLEKVLSGALTAAYGDDPLQLDLMEHIAAIAAHMDPDGPSEGLGEDRTGPQRAKRARTGPDRSDPAPLPPSSNTGVSSAGRRPRKGSHRHD